MPRDFSGRLPLPGKQFGIAIASEFWTPPLAADTLAKGGRIRSLVALPIAGPRRPCVPGTRTVLEEPFALCVQSCRLVGHARISASRPRSDPLGRGRRRGSRRVRYGRQPEEPTRPAPPRTGNVTLQGRSVGTRCEGRFDCDTRPPGIGDGPALARAEQRDSVRLRRDHVTSHVSAFDKPLEKTAALRRRRRSGCIPTHGQ